MKVQNEKKFAFDSRLKKKKIQWNVNKNWYRHSSSAYTNLSKRQTEKITR